MSYNQVQVTFEEMSMEHPKQRKTRKKANSIKRYVYHVPDHLCDRISIDDVEKSTGANITKLASSAGQTPFAISGTRAQTQEALRMINVVTGEQTAVMQRAQTFWIQWIENVFPDFESCPYFLPPVFVRRVPMVKKTISGQNVFQLIVKEEVTSLTSARASVSDLTSIQESDLAFDDAIQRVLSCLKQMAMLEQEVFMCLSQFPFGSYLGEPEFAPAAAHLPLPCNLSTKFPWSWRQGGFDVLIIHRQYGFVICQVKAVGYNTDTSQEDRDKHVTKKLKEAAEQLDKAEAMLSHLVSDICSSVRITKTIACPNLTTLDIQKVISENEQLKEDLRLCFKLQDPHEIASMIISSDHLSALENLPYFSKGKLKLLTQWWRKRVIGPGPEGELINHPVLYKKLLARFCGPASTVQIPSITEPRLSIKTFDKAVAYIGDCYAAYLTLFPEQLELLSAAPARVFIVGPPGTGKTVVLLLMAAKWLLRGDNIYILSTWECSRTAASMMRKLLEEILEGNQNKELTPGHIYTVQKNFRKEKEVKEALDELASADGQRSLHVIADEPGPYLRSHEFVFFDFCLELLLHVQQQGRELHFWTASCQEDVMPIEPTRRHGWKRKLFTRPLRSPPSVKKEVEKAVEIRKICTVPGYNERGVPDFADGPPVEWIFHQCQQHGSSRSEDCNVCGIQVAKFLTNKLGLGTSASPTTGMSTSGSRRDSSLSYRDVLIICEIQLPENTGVVKALTEANIPVKVMKDSDIEDVATGHSDVVWAARRKYVHGLERKVVVVMNNYEDSKGDHLFTRLYAMSRCSSQLLVVCPPPGYTGPSKC